ncbi:MAG: hypothetical protein CMN98_06330 [Synechococcus sp. NP17]|nr:hypothetical protein [Synechococcus sp. NP17]
MVFRLVPLWILIRDTCISKDQRDADSGFCFKLSYWIERGLSLGGCDLVSVCKLCLPGTTSRCHQEASLGSQR